MKKKFKENGEYHKLFDTGNKGFLTQQEKIIYNIFTVKEMVEFINVHNREG